MKAIFKYSGTLEDLLTSRSGAEVEVKRQLDASEVDQVSNVESERIIMYEVAFADGFKAHVFNDELEHIS